MARTVQIVACLAGMVGVWWLLRAVVYDIDRNFGIGFGLGMGAMAALMRAAEMVEERQRAKEPESRPRPPTV